MSNRIRKGGVAFNATPPSSYKPYNRLPVVLINDKT